MENLFVVFAHILATIAKLLRPGGAKALVSENLLLKQQLLVINRSRLRAPNLTPLDRLFLGFLATLLGPHRTSRSAIIIRSSTIMGFHQALKKRKYRLLYSSKRRSKPGPKGPSPELIQLILEMKRRNPRFGTPRIAQEIARTFGIDIDKDVVRRVLAKHYRPGPGDGPSWLTFIGHMKDSLWSVDLFRCESIVLRTHWVLVVMDQFTRRIIGFGVHAGDVDGPALCRMFNQATIGKCVPRYLSSDHDPLFRYHRWKANLRIREIKEIKTVPHAPLSHPFTERLVGTVRRECLDQTLFWNGRDLEEKLGAFQDYYNAHRVHQALNLITPEEAAGKDPPAQADLRNYAWMSHCRDLFQTPIAA
ncbi:integrase core domain-containing protein [Nitrospinota bacterium]